MEELDGLLPAVINWLPPDNEICIGTVLYHLAVIEADWLYEEVLQQPYPAEVIAIFPYEVRDEQGQLTQIQGISLDQHLQMLKKVRSLVLDVYQQMTLSDYRRVRSLPKYDVSPEWVLHHLMQHEAEHRSQIGALRARAEQSLGLR